MLVIPLINPKQFRVNDKILVVCSKDNYFYYINPATGKTFHAERYHNTIKDFAISKEDGYVNIFTDTTWYPKVDMWGNYTEFNIRYRNLDHTFLSSDIFFEKDNQNMIGVWNSKTGYDKFTGMKGEKIYAKGNYMYLYTNQSIRLKRLDVNDSPLGTIDTFLIRELFMYGEHLYVLTPNYIYKYTNHLTLLEVIDIKDEAHMFRFNGHRFALGCKKLHHTELNYVWYGNHQLEVDGELLQIEFEPDGEKLYVLSDRNITIYDVGMF